MAKTSAQPARGTRDFLPLDMRRRNHVVSIIRKVFEAHGFEPLETPAIERLDALLGKYGEEGDQLLFKVLLRGQPLVEGIRSAAEHIADPAHLKDGRSGVTAPSAEPMLADLGLRYDLTVPLARVYAAYQGKLPAVWKRYQIQPVWRADTPGKGRFREFYQCDIDVVGASSPIVEAEVLSIAADCLHALGFPSFDLRINHRGLLRALIESCGITAALEAEAITAVDKLDKIGADGVSRELHERGIDPASTTRLLELLGGHADLERVERALSDHTAGTAALHELREVMRLAELTAAGPHLRFDATLARGLGYYTGAIYEIAVPDLGSSMGGGGRYDGLIGMFLGRDVPACGLTLGLERILVVMAERNMYPIDLQSVDVLLAAAREQDLELALQLAQTLRKRGLRVDLSPRAENPGKLRKRAEAEGIAAVSWIDRERSEGASLWLRATGQSESGLDAAAIASKIAATLERSP